jgi:hypothetical protein
MALTGQITVALAGTKVQGPNEPGSLFRLKGKPGNTGAVFFGDASVSAAAGYPLDAGEDVEIETSNLNTLYFDAANNGDVCAWLKVW